MRNLLFILLLALGVSTTAIAQNDTIRTDSTMAATLPDSIIAADSIGDIVISTGHSAGIYLVPGDSLELPLQPVQISLQQKTSGVLGSIAMSVGGIALGTVIGGIGGAVAGNVFSGVDFNKQQLVVQGKTSAVQIRQRDVPGVRFRFYLPKNESPLFQNVVSGNDFICVRLNAKRKKRVFSKNLSLTLFGARAGNLQSGSDDIMAPEFSQVDTTTSELSFPDGLQPGEYCFMYKDALLSISQSSHAYAFDFTVTE